MSNIKDLKWPEDKDEIIKRLFFENSKNSQDWLVEEVFMTADGKIADGNPHIYEATEEAYYRIWKQKYFKN